MDICLIFSDNIFRVNDLQRTSNRFITLAYITALCLICASFLAAFPQPANAQQPPSTPTTEAPLSPRDHPVIRVVGDQNYPPYSFLQDGKPSGFDNEIIQAVGNAMGFDVQIDLLPWSEARARLDNGEADVIAGMAYLESREPIYDFSIPTTKITFDLFVRHDSPIRSLEDARNKAIIVQAGGAMQDYLSRNDLTNDIISVTNVTDALWALNLGDYDAALLNRVQGLYIIQSMKFDRLKAVGIEVSPVNYGFAVHEGNLNLLEELNAGLTTIKAQGIYDQIYQKWFSVYEPKVNQNNIRWLIFAVIGLLIVLTGLLLWTWRLRLQLLRRNQALQSTEEKYKLLVESTTEAVVVIQSGRVVFINPRALTISGYTREELIGNSPFTFVHPADRELAQQRIQARMHDETPGEGTTFRLFTKAGDEIILQTRSVQIEWEGKPAVLVLLTDITTHRNAENQIQQQVQRLAALREVDEAITSSIDLSRTLEIILDQVTRQLNVDAACVLLYNPHTDQLEYATGRGFYTSLMSAIRLKRGQGFAWRAFISKKPVYVPDMTGVSNDLMNTAILETEGLVAFYGLPLDVKGEIKGILELFHRSELPITPDWMNFAESIGRQAAIAIDNASLFADLQIANRDLTQAYDDTIRGWAIALELRDGETEGHSQRVTAMTERLAKAMGVPDELMKHLRRGALLHDIGKMAIPDAILFKPGPLTREEREIMRRHPVYAYDLLASIDFLRPAMDIPYSHHERWNGTGYPLGLIGDQIPLAARIFAVVDVWDALSSDRPYRKAWPAEDIITYLLEQSGKQFDPEVVSTFIHLLQEDEPMKDNRTSIE